MRPVPIPRSFAPPRLRGGFALALAGVALATALGGEPPAAKPSAGQPDAPATPPATTAPVEVFPGVRLDKAAQAVEFDAEVIADLSDPKKVLYLEVLACPRDTKEHESLVYTRVKPSQVHAALLAAGLRPGTPVTWRTEGGRTVSTPPKGDPVRVEFRWRDPATSEEKAASPLEWVVNAKASRRASEEPSGFVFAGSAMIKRPDGTERYDADAAGTLVGLASFGSEVIAWTGVFSPESSVAEPVWTADRARVPALGTKVTVRIAPEPDLRPKPGPRPQPKPEGAKP